LLNFSHKITLSRKSFFQKGDVLIKLKKKKQASELFTRYLEMFPESDIKSSIDDYIKKGLITLNTKSVR